MKEKAIRDSQFQFGNFRRFVSVSWEERSLGRRTLVESDAILSTLQSCYISRETHLCSLMINYFLKISRPCPGSGVLSPNAR